MAPQKFASVRHKNKPTSLVFRDDAGLVAFRYEKTAQAVPPIPFVSRRNSSRGQRPASSTTSPIIVAPPPISPNEQHPAFRTPSLARTQSTDNWKRDSGLAPTTASSITIHEECDSTGLDYHQKTDERDISPSSIWSAVRVRAESGRDGEASPSCASTPTSGISEPAGTPEPHSPQAAALDTGFRPVNPINSQAAIQDEHHTVSTAGQGGPVTPSRKVSKSFSFRSSASKKLRRKTQSDDPIAPAPMPEVRGPAPTAAPGSPKSPKQGKRAGDAEPCSSLADSPFLPITTSIPTDSLLDDEFFTQLSFSKRGSMMLGGKRTGSADSLAPYPIEASKAKDDATTFADHTTDDDVHDAKSGASPPQPQRPALTPPHIRVMSADAEWESQKVRSLYEVGDSINWQDGGRLSPLGDRLDRPEEGLDENELDPPPPNAHLTPLHATPRSGSSLSQRPESRARREYELAGGLEDWEDVHGGEVDRYGFISPRPIHSRSGTPEPKSPMHSPRKRNVLVKRDPAAHASTMSPPRGPTRKVSARSLNTQASDISAVSRRSTRSSIRAATNLLPRNRERRWMDEASDMLTLPPGLADIAEDEKVEKITESMKKKEWERSEKWRKMAKVRRSGKDGEGMEFEFDVKNPKLIERTWKGIPDRWRASAWYSFLATSAAAAKNSDSEKYIMSEFHRLQDVASPDDVQIDLDVPRTINRHIMFRRRYRGGQRLLFRVLHALSLYYPDTGYVQGMASLAATLLCYFDEEKCFVMLVRMWRFRGLNNLYQPGFSGLMAALHDLEVVWMGGKEVANKLSDLSIDATAYATRWYLTLFNLSIPFQAQLRVWDVFLLLGESPPESASAKGQTTHVHGIDVLHATSTALLHALGEILLDSDFENAMKALTSWVPIKDEDILMKVARAEWKQHQGKRKT